jgi:hypothetical protein
MHIYRNKINKSNNLLTCGGLFFTLRLTGSSLVPHWLPKTSLVLTGKSLPTSEAREVVGMELN